MKARTNNAIDNDLGEIEDEIKEDFKNKVEIKGYIKGFERQGQF